VARSTRVTSKTRQKDWVPGNGESERSFISHAALLWSDALGDWIWTVTDRGPDFTVPASRRMVLVQSSPGIVEWHPVPRSG
jgi:hypothetical protein